jgi:hypothetical protein
MPYFALACVSVNCEKSFVTETASQSKIFDLSKESIGQDEGKGFYDLI